MADMITAVAVLSSDHLWIRPTSGPGAAAAAQAHKRFASHEGDLPTYVHVYQAWQQETRPLRQKYNPHKKKQQGGGGLLTHRDWCQRNFVSGRALLRAENIRNQLRTLCRRSIEQHGLGLVWSDDDDDDDSPTHLLHDSDERREQFLKCCAAGLFLQAASRNTVAETNTITKGRSGDVSQYSRNRYQTKVGKEWVSIHPTSTLFGRHPAPKCVVYTELVTTKKTYIRGVTQIREEWLSEVAPKFYPSETATD
jgi:HrpA-like RNA helicase